MREIRYAARVLLNSPVFTLTALVTLSLCIGANTAIYSVVDAVLFRPLPYPEPERLAQVVRSYRSSAGSSDGVSQDGRTWETVRDHATHLDSAVYGGASGVNFATGHNIEFVQQQRVSAGFFHVLGVAPLLGREFTRAEDVPNGAPVAVLSHGFWKRVFQEDPAAIGRTIKLRGEPFTVVGIMPAGFQTDWPADLWTPLRPSTKGEGAGTNYSIIARLRPGVSWGEADAEMTVLGETALKEVKPSKGVSLRLAVIPLQLGLTQDLRKAVFIFWGSVGVVLLIGCVNSASLLLARAAGRTREMATRMALGCGRIGLIRQMLVESLLLGICGAAGGILCGYLLLQALGATAHELLGVWQTLELDPRVLAVTIGLALLASLIFGLSPAFYASRVDIHAALAEGGGRGVAGGRSRWPRRILVACEVALGFVLLIGAGLLIRTFAYLNHVTPGFDPENVLTASLSLQDARYDTADKANRLFDETLSRIRALPGVEAAGVGLSLPYQRPLNVGFRRIAGSAPEEKTQITNLTYVTPGYFEALRIPVLAGRLLAESDSATAAPVVLVNEQFVKDYFQDQAPLGRQIRISSANREIVGVVRDVQQRPGWGTHGPIAPMAGVFMPASQNAGSLMMVHTWFSPNWVVRTTRPRGDLAREMQRAVTAVDPELPFAAFRTMEEVKLRTLGFQRFQAVLLALLAGLALLLVAVGLYGLISNSVAERRREMGIRLALGATTAQAMWSVMAPGLALAVAGVGFGWLLAGNAAKALQHFIWGVTPADPATFTVVALGMLAVAALASLLPALRIAKLNPAETLRNE